MSGANFVVLALTGCIATGCFDTTHSCGDFETCPPDDAGQDGGYSDARESGLSDADVDAWELGRDQVAVDSLSDAGVGAEAEAEAAPTCDRTKTPDQDPCVIDEQYGVFVSPRPGDAGFGVGTRAKPYQSLDVALSGGLPPNTRVYVCDDGTGYSDPLTVYPEADGAQIFGGFECAGWTYSTSRRATIRATRNPALRITGLTLGMSISDLEVIAPDGATPGESSIAILVTVSPAVTMTRVRAVAGKGADGAPGADGSAAPASSGAPGHVGADACGASGNLGGATAAMTCGATDTSGGKGGDGAIGPTASGGNGEGGRPDTASRGSPGFGQTLASFDCSVGAGLGGGNGGAPGEDGSPGAGATGPGALSVAGWSGVAGAAGTVGKPGQGGGGGGGAKAPAACVGDAGPSTPTGAAAGGGGAGGCGGAPGQGGLPGGASIGVVSYISSLTFDGEIVTAAGGAGGKGGSGQAGGGGGAPGAGGAGSNGSRAACDGGRGGQGGNGGFGGGGAGGHSIGIAWSGGSAMSTATATLGQPGAGSGASATTGIAVQMLEFR